MTATLTPRPRPPQPHPAAHGWRPGQGPPAAWFAAMERWLGPPALRDARAAAVEAWGAAAQHRQDAELALALALLSHTGNPVEAEDLDRGQVWRDWGNLDPAGWPEHDRKMAAIRETVATPRSKRSPAMLAAIADMPARFERLFISWDITQAAADGLAVTDPDVEDSPDLELARRRVASKLAS